MRTFCYSCLKKEWLAVYNFNFFFRWFQFLNIFWKTDVLQSIQSCKDRFLLAVPLQAASSLSLSLFLNFDNLLSEFAWQNVFFSGFFLWFNVENFGVKNTTPGMVLLSLLLPKFSCFFIYYYTVLCSRVIFFVKVNPVRKTTLKLPRHLYILSTKWYIWLCRN